MPSKPYIARGVLRNGHTNSVLSGSIARKIVVHRHCDSFIKQAQEETIDAGHGIKLLAHINKQDNHDCPLVILLHGWLGCSGSLYILSLGKFLFDHGYHVVRLNLRDHGFTEHLNEKIFHSCRIQEIINSCAYLHHSFNTETSIIGFSLGGNFALRVNAYTTNEEFKLNKTISICPVIDPSSTLVSLEDSFFVYQNYFMQRWKQSFHRKAKAFPNIYSRETFNKFKTLREATEELAIHYAGFDSLKSYLEGYSIAEHRLTTLRAPAYVVLAKDDPIIPWNDHNKLASSSYLKPYFSDNGGHCGFLEPNLSNPWIDEFCLNSLSQ
ncbi:MAG: alpha/beta fold hydrolase [Pseudomonadota bacterium]